MKAWLRPLIVSVLLGFSAFLLYVASDSQAEVEPEVRRAGLVRVFPAPGAVALRQDAIGAEIGFGYEGRLAIDRRVLPDDQIDKIPGINRLSFTPGEGKEFSALDEGRHCVRLTYWRTASGEESAGEPFVWCFTAA